MSSSSSSPTQSLSRKEVHQFLIKLAEELGEATVPSDQREKSANEDHAQVAGADQGAVSSGQPTEEAFALYICDVLFMLCCC